MTTRDLTTSTIQANPVTRTLGAILGKRRLVLRLTRLAQSAGVLIGLGLCFVLIDAFAPLSAWLRLLLDAILAGVVAIGAWRLRTPARNMNRQILHEARRMETQMAEPFNALVNAVWLPEADEQNQLSGELVQRAAKRGEQTAQRIDQRQAVNRTILRRYAVGLAVLLSLWVMLFLVQPRLIPAVAARFADPYGDHPPYSLTVFDVQIDPEAFEPGQDVLVSAKLSGKIPSSLQMVRVDALGQELERWAMTPKAADHFQRRLRALRQPFTFYLQSSTGRTQRYTLTPIKKEPIDKAPINGTDTKQNGATDTKSNANGSSAAGDAQSARLREILANLRALMDATNRMQRNSQSLSDRLRELKQDDPIPDWLLERLEQMIKQLDRFGQRTDLTESELRQLAQSTAKDNPELGKLLQEMAQLLLQLQLMKMTKGPKPSGQAQGAGAGRGAKPWIDQLTEAAKRDQLKLQSLARQLGEATDGSQSRAGGGEPQPLKTPDAKGHYHQKTGTTLKSNSSVPDAVMEQVPASYRELVDRYYRRLRKDEITNKEK